MINLNELMNKATEVITKESFGEYDLRVFSSISFENGKYFISLQASYAHYCIPRKTLYDLEEYESFEVLLYVPFEDIPPHWQEKYCSEANKLFGYVDKDEIKKFLERMIKKYRLDVIKK